MAEIKIKKNSWLNLTKLLRFGEVLFWDHFDFPEVPYSDSDRYVQLSQNGAQRLDLIAYDFYGDATLVWVVQLANNLDYPTQAYEGLTIRLPAMETVQQLLRNK